MKLRFFLFAFLAAALPLVVAAVVTAEVAIRSTAEVERRVSSAAGMLQSRLEADAARRRELLLRLTSLEGITQPISDAVKAGEVPAPGVLAALRDAVHDVDAREQPELLVVATAQGAQVGAVNGEPRQVAAGDVPLVGAALAGHQAEGFARFDGALFRISAAPVGVADAALVVGDRVGDSTAARLREIVKASGVTFAAGGIALASTLTAEQRAVVAAAAAHPNAAVRHGTVTLGVPGLSFLDGVFPLLVPEGEFVSLASDVGGGSVAIVTFAVGDDLAFLGRVQLLALAMFLGLMLLSLLWMRAIFGPLERQSRSIEAHLVRLRVERNARLGTKGFSHPFLEVVQELDRLSGEFGREGSAPREPRADAKGETTPPGSDARPPSRAPLDLPLAPSPALAAMPDDGDGTPSAFPFKDDPVATRTGPSGRAKELKGARMQLPVADPPTSPPTPRPMPKAEPKPLPRPDPKLSSTLESLDEAMPASDSSMPIPLPGGRNLPPKADPFAAFGPTPEPDLGDRTRKAAIPAELLARSRELEQELLETPADPDEDHFLVVYDEFVALRKKCGEAADGLTFDKFAARLKKNREQLVEKYKCKTVRFQVYVKEGKAAVKAAPVR